MVSDIKALRNLTISQLFEEKEDQAEGWICTYFAYLFNVVVAPHHFHNMIHTKIILIIIIIRIIV